MGGAATELLLILSFALENNKGEARRGKVRQTMKASK